MKVFCTALQRQQSVWLIGNPADTVRLVAVAIMRRKGVETNVAEVLSKEWSTLHGGKEGMKAEEERCSGEGRVMCKGKGRREDRRGKRKGSGHCGRPKLLFS